MDSTRLIGQRIVAGFDGFTIPENFAELVKREKIGNVILFRRNIQSPEQLRALCEALESLIQTETGLPPFLFLDEEGGTVSRLAPIGIFTPSAMAVGQTDDPNNAFAMGSLIGQELRSVGISFNLAPVLDCADNPDNPAVGVRCFSREPDKTARFGTAFFNGLHSEGVLACAKHFPGQGGTAVDTHVGLPVVEQTRAQLEADGLVSFREAVRAGVDAIMVTHAVFTALDELPASVSRRVMTDMLREEWGFSGLILSDCMEMDAVRKTYGTPEAAVMALEAGADLTLICHTLERQREAARLAARALETGRMPEAEAAFERIAAVKRALSARPEKAFPPLGCEAHRALARAISRQAVRVLHAPAGKPLPRVDQTALFFGCASRPTTFVSDVERLDAAYTLARAFGGTYASRPWAVPDVYLPGAAGRTVVATVAPGEELEEALSMVRAFVKAGANVIAVSMTTPHCLAGLPDAVWKAAAYQYDPLGLESLEVMLR